MYNTHSCHANINQSISHNCCYLFSHAWENIHSIFIMDKERFIHFRADFVKFIDLIKKGNDIDSLLNSLLLEYQELTCDSVLPNLVMVPIKIEKESLKNNLKKDNLKLKNIEEITKKLMASVVDQRWTDFTTLEIKMENEEACFQTLKQLDEAEADARKRIIYFSCLKGQVLQRLKDISGKKMNQLLKLTEYCQGHAYFLIKLHKLVLEYNKLMYSNLPIRFFKTNLREIETICKSNEMFFK